MIRACPIPEGALLLPYTRMGYADCYITELPGVVSHAEYVEAFYTGAVFRLERLLLAWFASRPSTDAQAKQLASGETDSFAAWSVEARAPNQLLVRAGRTRSWLMTVPAGGATRLYFGSAVVARDGRMGFLFNALLGFHKLYSRMLLRSAGSRIRRSK